MVPLRNINNERRKKELAERCVLREQGKRKTKNERRKNKTSVVDATNKSPEGFGSPALITGKSLDVLLCSIITNRSIFILK